MATLDAGLLARERVAGELHAAHAPAGAVRRARARAGQLLGQRRGQKGDKSN